MKSSKERYEKVLSRLKDQLSTIFYLVSRAEKSSLKEAARTSIELNELGMTNQKLLINGLFNTIDRNDKTALKVEETAQKQLSSLPEALQNLERTNYPLLPYNILGLEKLRSLFNTELQKTIINLEIPDVNEARHTLPDLSELVNALEENSNSGLIMTMGKGGVGKTIVAATIATILANRGHTVLLTTTDPAAHVKDFINQLDQLPENLTMERIDPKVETKNYSDKIIEQKGTGLDEEGRKLLIEDLKSPCTEEVAVFNAFSKAIHKAKRQLVVMELPPQDIPCLC